MTKLTDKENSLETQATMLDRRVNETKNDLKKKQIAKSDLMLYFASLVPVNGKITDAVSGLQGNADSSYYVIMPES